MRGTSTDKPAGKIDLVVARTSGDDLRWYGLEIQAVYFSGKGMQSEFLNLRDDAHPKPPFPDAVRRPDWRSSSAKAPHAAITDKGFLLSDVGDHELPSRWTVPSLSRLEAPASIPIMISMTAMLSGWYRNSPTTPRGATDFHGGTGRFSPWRIRTKSSSLPRRFGERRSSEDLKK